MKGNQYWRDPFFTSMIVGGRVYTIRPVAWGHRVFFFQKHSRQREEEQKDKRAKASRESGPEFGVHIFREVQNPRHPNTSWEGAWGMIFEVQAPPHWLFWCLGKGGGWAPKTPIELYGVITSAPYKWPKIDKLVSLGWKGPTYRGYFISFIKIGSGAQTKIPPWKRRKMMKLEDDPWPHHFSTAFAVSAGECISYIICDILISILAHA